jgi:predicted phosphoribosyltransferase
VRVINDEVVGTLGISDRLIEAVAAREQEELQRRERVYRRGRPMAVVQNRQAILVDDGLATGATMRAAVDGLRMHRPSRIIVAVPVGPADTCRELRRLVDEMVCLQTPEPFGGVGAWYEEFRQVADDEVAALLEKGARLPFEPDREGGPVGGAG